jgi:hypothetical protein
LKGTPPTGARHEPHPHRHDVFIQILVAASALVWIWTGVHETASK